MNDLFLKKKSKKEELWDWLSRKTAVRTSEVIKWGVEHFSNRADRYCRDFANEGKLRRMDEQKKQNIFGCVREEIWEVVG